jgi:hypothetical protein
VLRNSPHAKAQRSQRREGLQVAEGLGDDVDHSVPLLDPAGDTQEARGLDEHDLLLEDPAPDDHFHESGLVLGGDQGRDLRIRRYSNTIGPTGELMQDHDQKNLYPGRVAAFRRFNEWEEQHPLELDPEEALAAIGALYDLIPPEARKRAVDTESVRKMHAALSCLKGRS